MKALLATCGVAALFLAACGGPHGPPTKSAQTSGGPEYPKPRVAAAFTGGPHGPPRVLQNPYVPTEPTLNEDIWDKFDAGGLSETVRICKTRHLKAYRAKEDDLRALGPGLDPGEVIYLENWMNMIVFNVYTPDIPQPNLVADPGVIPGCRPW
jgi:hypothetical protein